jgi:hypothetical protein
MDLTDILIEVGIRVFIVCVIAWLLLLIGFTSNNVLTMMLGMSGGSAISMLWNHRKAIMAFINGPESEA